MTRDTLPAALHRMALTLGDQMTAGDVGPAFSCGEAEAVAEVLILSGHVAAAEVWLRGHAGGDDGGDLHGVCRYCDALLHLPDPDEASEACVDLWGRPRCSDGEHEHEPTSWVQEEVHS